MGLSLIFGVLEIVNFAHGEFYMLAAMLAYFLTVHWGFGYWTTIVVGDRRSASPLATSCSRACCSALRGESVRAQHPAHHGPLHGAAERRGVPVHHHADAWSRRRSATRTSSGATCACRWRGSIALVLGVVAFGALYLILHRTRLGKAMRGVAQNRVAAMMVGIDSRVVSRLAVAIGIGLSGLAGAALAPIYSVHPLMGFSFVFKAFAIIIIGGLGNISGAAIAAVMLGVIESLAGGLLPLAMVDALAFVAMIAVLLLRPQGLFGRGVRV